MYLDENNYIISNTIKKTVQFHASLVSQRARVIFVMLPNDYNIDINLVVKLVFHLYTKIKYERKQRIKVCFIIKNAVSL